MASSPLLDLPAELRVDIYKLVLYQEKAIFATPGLICRTKISPPKQRHALALTKTCREMRNECWNLFYELNTFFLTMGNVCLGGALREGHLDDFYTIMGHENAAAMDTLILHGTVEIEGQMDPRKRLSEFLKFVAKASSYGGSHCRFRAKVEICSPQPLSEMWAQLFGNRHLPPESRIYCTTNLDFRNLEESWEESINASKHFVGCHIRSPDTKANRIEIVVKAKTAHLAPELAGKLKLSKFYRHTRRSLRKTMDEAAAAKSIEDGPSVSGQ